MLRFWMLKSMIIPYRMFWKKSGTTITLNTTDRLAGLTISTSKDSVATATGNVINGVSEGNATIQYLITEKPSVFASANVTVEANE